MEELKYGLLFSGSADRSIKVWDTGAKGDKDMCIQTLVGHGGTVSDVKYGDDNLISCSIDKTIKIWQAETGREHLLYPWYTCMQTIENGENWATAAAIRTGEMAALYIGDSAGTLTVYTPEAGHGKGFHGYNVKDARKQEHVHQLGITHCLLVPEQNFVITCSFDNSLRVFDAMNGVSFLTITNQQRCRFTGLSWNSLEQELFCVDTLGYLYVWNIYMEKLLKTERLHTTALGCLSMHNVPADGAAETSLVEEGEGETEGLLFVTGQDNTSVESWYIRRDLKFVEFVGHTEPVICVLATRQKGLSDDGGSEGQGRQTTGGGRGAEHRFFSASLDNTIRCWDPYDMSNLYTLNESVSEISSMLLLHAANLLVTGNDDGSIRWWNPDSGSTITLKSHTNTVSCLAVAHARRNDYLLSAGYDGAVGIWDVTKRRSVKPQLEFMFQAHVGDEREILCICYNAAQEDEARKGFVTGGNDCILRVWNLMGGNNCTLADELEGHTEPVTCLALDANFLFSGSDDSTIRIWNISTLGSTSRGREAKGTAGSGGAYCLSVLQAHADPVRDMLIIADLGYLVSCAFDGRIKVWDYNAYDEATGETGKVVKEYRHHNEFRCLAYNAGHGEILSGTQQNKILLFQLPPHLIDERRRQQLYEMSIAVDEDDEPELTDAELADAAAAAKQAADGMEAKAGSKEEAAVAQQMAAMLAAEGKGSK
jgi:WD40 repeat protein